ncbi:MAG: arsinothricin resistance N-acetyltransferase ArsN1 family B [Bythopirellula sp.]|nr:arsinothricin resistance N-acetyltransferase ArsN1 family B [Bythopirellula sp.]
MIRDVAPLHAPAISVIYNWYIAETVISFEEEPVTVEEMAGRIQAVIQQYPWIVLEIDGTLIGYAYARRWHERSAYRHTVEVGVYVAHDRVGCGHGTELYRELISRLPALDIHAAIGGITLPNEASVSLHEKFGFTKVAHYREVGYKFGNWHDVGYWQLLLPSSEGSMSE